MYAPMGSDTVRRVLAGQPPLNHRSDCKLLPGLEEGWGLTDTVLFFLEQHALCLRPGQTIPPTPDPYSLQPSAWGVLTFGCNMNPWNATGSFLSFRPPL